MPDHNQLFLRGFMLAGGEEGFGENGFPGKSGEAVFGFIPSLR